MSNKGKFWLGVVLALPALLVGGFIVGLAPAVTAGDTGTTDVGFFLGLVIFVLELVGLVTLIVMERTRWIGLGILAGIAILFILAAGACIVLIVGLTNSY